MPLGFRFSPTDSELMFHLWNKIRNPSYDHPAVTVHDFYSQELWLLPRDSSKNRFFHGNECYFFLRRDNGARLKRAVDYGRGWWNADTTEDKHDAGRDVGCVKSLTFFVNDEKRQKQGRGNWKREGTKTDWIMHEYLYHQKSVKEWVLYRIRYNGRDPLQPAPQQCVGPDLQLPPFCLGPDSQLPTLLTREKIGVAAKRVQEKYAPTLYNEEIQETREMINNTGFEWSEVVVGRVHQEPTVEKDCWFQQQQPAEPLEEYDAKELQIDSEALVVSPLQQQKQEQTLEICDDNFAEELEPKLEIKSEPAEQLHPLQQAPEEKTGRDCDEELLENFDFSQLPLDNKEFAWMEKEFGIRSLGDLWDDQVWYWMGEEY